jgi:hypothetical protein
VAVGTTISFLNNNDGTSSSNDCEKLLSDYPYLKGDGSLAACLYELSGLYSRVDPAVFEDLLKSLDELVSLQGAPGSIRTGQRNVAKALRARRICNASLIYLQSGARRRFHCQTLDVAEDEKAVSKAITDVLHNIQQSCALSSSPE